MFGIALQNSNHEDEALEVFECQDGGEFEMRVPAARQSANVGGKSKRRRAGNAWTRFQFKNCVSHDSALRPGAGPALENPVCFDTVFQTGDEALLCLFGIACQQQGKLVEIIQALSKQGAKVPAGGIFICLLLSNPVLSRAYHLASITSFRPSRSGTVRVKSPARARLTYTRQNQDEGARLLPNGCCSGGCLGD